MFGAKKVSEASLSSQDEEQKVEEEKVDASAPVQKMGEEEEKVFVQPRDSPNQNKMNQGQGSIFATPFVPK